MAAMPKPRAARTTRTAKTTRPRRRSAAQGKLARTLPGATRGRASAALPAEGDAPVQAYIASLPPQQRAIAERFDALIGRTIPGIRRCIKWGMAFYGTERGWFVSCGGFADHVKVTFLHGTSLKPTPPVGTGKFTRGVDLETPQDLDAQLLAAWIRQAATRPGLGAGRR